MNNLTSKELSKAFGNHLRKLRKEKGITQEKLAGLVHCQTSTISRIEQGQTNAKLLTIKGIAEALNIDIVDLLTFDN